MNKKNVKKSQTIKWQIFRGYFILTGMIAFLVAISIACLLFTQNRYNEVAGYQLQQQTSQSVITAHYKWLEQLSDSITTGAEFKGSLDPNSCALGKWIASAGDELEKNAEMADALAEIVEPHKAIHLEAEELIGQSLTNKDAAYEKYSSDFKPKVEIIGEGLTKISNLYQQNADVITENVKLTSVIANVILFLAGVLTVVISLSIGRRLSGRISKPILAVAQWSEKFATGVDNLDLRDEENFSSDVLEINRMVKSFKGMAAAIRKNVDVIKKVSGGDLTAYVEICSEGDSLGQNLYHLVQNNDFMFSNLLQVADSVATSAETIAETSQMLAQNSVTQSGAVEVLSVTVDKANSIASENSDRSRDTADTIRDMEQIVRDGREHMDALVNAVNDIRQASEKIAIVMKSINDIAFQTNILALNAAVEAARAGSAGKGFAVVADEVRNLAAKSAEAADQSRMLIEDTIRKAAEGNRMVAETSQTFGTIVERTTEINSKMDEILHASHDQQECMHEIHGEISRISAVAADNAASSEETAATTQEMNANAEYIRVEMHRFNLRKRETGKAYIPPEKRNDAEFVRMAQENYAKSRSGSEYSNKKTEKY